MGGGQACRVGGHGGLRSLPGEAMNRADVLLARFPHPSGGRGKKRPVVVVQADVYNQSLRTLLVAEVTKNLYMANDPACLFIDASTPEGQATGIVQDSVVSCLLMATI